MFEFENKSDNKIKQIVKESKKSIILGLLTVLVILMVMNIKKYTSSKIDLKKEYNYYVLVDEGNYLEELQFLNYYNKTKEGDMPEIKLVVKEGTETPKMVKYVGDLDDFTDETIESTPYTGILTIYKLMKEWD